MKTIKLIVPQEIVRHRKVTIKVVGEVKNQNGHALLVTRAEAERVYCMSLPAWSQKDAGRLRNYELNSYLDEWAGISSEDENARHFIVNEWCPFNGVWSPWSRFASVEYMVEEIHRMGKMEREDPGQGCLSAASYLEKMINERLAPQVMHAAGEHDDDRHGPASDCPDCRHHATS